MFKAAADGMIWWLIVAFYAGLIGGIFITCVCMQFKRSNGAGIEEGVNRD